MNKQQVVFFTFQTKTVFIPLRYIYPECMVLIERHQQLSPLHCLSHDHCPANANCMEVLAKRVNYFFTHVVPDVELMIAYFRYRDRPNSIRAGVFTKGLEEPRVMTVNPFAFRKFQQDSVSFTWVPPDEFLFMGPSSNLIPVENLLVKPNNDTNS